MRCAVIPFEGRVSPFGLSLRDRMDVALWQSRLRHLGYDRVVIHERNAGDPPEVESFLSIYREGDAFARWGVARRGDRVLAWCSATGEDVGGFASVGEALMALFPMAPGPAYDPRAGEGVRAFC